MSVQRLDIPGAWTYLPNQIADSRGVFFEWFQDSTFIEFSESRFDLAQANFSISHKGVLRGIHFALCPPGQRKYVTCVSGSALDVLVDLRVGSPTFGQSKTLSLNVETRMVVSIPNGVGHGFMALEDNTSIIYLCDKRYNPDNEREIFPLDPDLAIKWPDSIDPILSVKDANAPSFKSAFEWLPKF